MEGANLFVVGLCGVHNFDGGLNLLVGQFVGAVSAVGRHEGGEEAALIADENYLLRIGQVLRQLSSIGSGAMLWPELRMISS